MSVDVGKFKTRAFSAQDYPAQGSATERLLFLLRYAVLAPSICNSQPWQFLVSADRIEIYPDPARHLVFADSDRRALYISLGCAMENLIIAAERFEFGWQVSLDGRTQDGSVLPAIGVRLLPGCPIEAGRDPALFDVITTRGTWPGAFDERPIARDDIAWLSEFCPERHIGLHGIIGDNVLMRIAELYSQAIAIQNAKDEYRNEAALWRRANKQWHLRGFVQGLMEALFGRGAIDQSNIDLHGGTGLILMTATDRSIASYLACGQAYQRMSLAAANVGIAFQPVDALMQVDSLRAALRDLVDSDDEPLMLFRLGHVPDRAKNELAKTPRRPVESIARIAE